MKRPILRFIYETLIAIALLLGLGVILLTTRLDKGPLSLEPILPEIAGLVSDLAPGLSFEIGDATLMHGEGRIVFLMKLRDVTIFNKEKKAIGSLQGMQLGYSWRSILQLMIIPRVLILEKPTVHVTRFQDGHIGFNLQGPIDEEKEGSDVPELAHLMATAPSAFREIQVQDAWIKFIDLKGDYEAELTRGNINLTRRQNQVTGTLAMNIAMSDFTQDIEGTIAYDPERDVTGFTAELKSIQTDRIIPMFPELPEALSVKMPIDMLATAYVDSKFQPIEIQLKLAGKKGSIEYAPYLPKEIPLSNFVGEARYNPVNGALHIDEISFNLFKDASASIAVDRKPVTKNDLVVSEIQVIGLLKNFPVDELKHAWPHAFATDAQEWVTNQISAGVVPQAGIHLTGELSADEKFTVTELSGKLKYEKLTVDYLSPMPPVKNVSGEAQFDVDNFNLFVTSGDLFDTKVKKADIFISGLSKPDQHIEITMDIEGPIKDAITTISSKPLEYPQEMGLTPGQFTGTGKTNLWLKFPLRHDLTDSMVEMKTEAVLDNMVMADAVMDLDVSGSGLVLKADTTQMSLAGQARLADGSVDLKWQEFFGDDVAQKTVVDVKGAITAGTLKGLRLPADDYFSGEAQADIHLKQDSKKNVNITVAADLAKAGLDIAELSASKAVGTPGKLSLNATTEENGTMTLNDMQVSWNGFQIADGAARWNKNSDLESATLKGLRSGRMKADITVAPIANLNGVDLTITGDVLDLSGYWTKKPAAEEEKKVPSNRLMNIRLRGKTVYLDPEMPLKNMQADLSLQGEDLVRGNIAASTDQGEWLFKQTVGAGGLREQSMTMRNAGQVLQALDMTDSVRGGLLELRGKSSKEKPKIVSGRMTMKNFTVVKAPVLARLINAFSPGGLVELLENRGLVFGKMESDFALESPQVIRLRNGKMAGASLGLSFSGRIYRDKGKLDIKGNIVPIEGLNKMVGQIPLIGQILTGLKGEGIIAAAYKIKGPTENPEVTVNPLSVFTPGILRSIFFDSGD